MSQKYSILIRYFYLTIVCRNIYIKYEIFQTVTLIYTNILGDNKKKVRDFILKLICIDGNFEYILSILISYCILTLQ